MTIKKVVYYRTANGRIPFLEWLESLKDNQTKDRIISRLDRLGLGNFGDYKFIAGGLFELRFHFGPGYRIYYGQDGDILVVLLYAGDKSSQGNDILKAFEYWLDYKRTV